MRKDINTFASFDNNILNLVALGEFSGEDHAQVFASGNFLYSCISVVYTAVASVLILTHPP